MDYEIAFEPDGLVMIRTHGTADLQGFRAYLSELVADPRWRPGSPTLVDHRALALAGLSRDDVARISEAVADLAPKLGAGRNATVVAADVDYGLARMWELLTDARVPSVLRIFQDIDEARAWLLEEL